MVKGNQQEPQHVGPVFQELKGPRFRADNHRYVGSWYGEHGDKVEEIKAIALSIRSVRQGRGPFWTGCLEELVTCLCLSSVSTSGLLGASIGLLS